MVNLLRKMKESFDKDPDHLKKYLDAHQSYNGARFSSSTKKLAKTNIPNTFLEFGKARTMIGICVENRQLL